MRRAYAAALAAALLTVVACTPDEEPPPGPAPSVAATGPTASLSKAWVADVPVRPDRVGGDVPWVWEYSDDVVVLGPRSLVALDRASGEELWRLPLGGRVCGATPSPSKVGLVAVTVGRCPAAEDSTGDGTGVATGAPATVRRTTIKAVDLESASVVWERPFDGAPQLDIGGEVLVAVDGCATRLIDISSGRPRGGLGIACSDVVEAGQGLVAVTREGRPRRWRFVDVGSRSTVAEVLAPQGVSRPRRILSADPLVVLAAGDDQLALVRVEDGQVRVLGQVPPDSVGALASLGDDSVVLADRSVPGALELSLDDGSMVGEVARVAPERWIPVARVGDRVLAFEGTDEGLVAGEGALTLRSLRDSSRIEVGDFAAQSFLGDTDLAAAGPRAVVIDDILLMPGPANAGVLAYRLSLP